MKLLYEVSIGAYLNISINQIEKIPKYLNTPYEFYFKFLEGKNSQSKLLEIGAGTGQNSDECIEECGSDNSTNPTNPNTIDKEIAEVVYAGLRDLTGYEVYRDNSLLDYVEETEYVDFISQTYKFCEEHNFSLEGDGRVILLDWNRSQINMNGFPSILFPYCRKDFTRGSWSNSPPPYYGNPHYKKYIEDNYGECPIPFPKDVKWWE